MSPEGNKISPIEYPLATISSLDSPTGVVTRPFQVLNLITKDERLLLSLKQRVVFFLESRQQELAFQTCIYFVVIINAICQTFRVLCTSGVW